MSCLLFNQVHCPMHTSEKLHKVVCLIAIFYSPIAIIKYTSTPRTSFHCFWFGLGLKNLSDFKFILSEHLGSYFRVSFWIFLLQSMVFMDLEHFNFCFEALFPLHSICLLVCPMFNPHQFRRNTPVQYCFCTTPIKFLSCNHWSIVRHTALICVPMHFWLVYLSQFWEGFLFV